MRWSARALVLCMSAQAFGSDWAILENHTFRFKDPMNTQRRFILLRLDEAPIKGSLAQLMYITAPSRGVDPLESGSHAAAAQQHGCRTPKYVDQLLCS